MKVWVLSHEGELYGVYSTKAKAQEQAAKLNGEEPEWEHDKPTGESCWTDDNWVIEDAELDADA